MMVKITEKCSMHCIHCMNDANEHGQHMTFDMLSKVIDFVNKVCCIEGFPLVITGGEPFEHPQIEEFLTYILDNTRCILAVTTNGLDMPKHYDFVKELQDKYGLERITFQVTTDKRYYPTLIDVEHPVYALDCVIVDSVQQIYPQGRALMNKLPWKSKGSKCINPRLVTKQIYSSYLSYDSLKFAGLLLMLLKNNIMCVPHISINGEIKLGESDLCPACSSIFKTEAEIYHDIINFQCHGCDIVNENLDPKVKEILES